MNTLTKQVLVAIAMAVGVANAAQADDRDEKRGPACSVHTLHGLYLFSASGFNISPAGALVPKALAEFIRFDGAGALTSPRGTVIIGGVQVPPPTVSVPGAYTLDENCIGTLAFLPAPGPTFDIFVFPRGEELVLVQTSQPPFLGVPIMQGTAVRVSR